MVAQENKGSRNETELSILKRKAKEILDETRRTDSKDTRRETDVANGKRRGEPAGQADEPAQKREALRRLPARRQEDDAKTHGEKVLLPPNPSRRENQLQELLSKNLSCCNLSIN